MITAAAQSESERQVTVFNEYDGHAHLRSEGSSHSCLNHAAYYPGEDGWFVVRVLDFPGVVSQGRTIAHARSMIKDVLRMMAEYRLEEGESMPRPNARARDKKAVLLEVIKLGIRVQSPAAR